MSQSKLDLPGNFSRREVQQRVPTRELFLTYQVSIFPGVDCSQTSMRHENNQCPENRIIYQLNLCPGHRVLSTSTVRYFYPQSSLLDRGDLHSVPSYLSILSRISVSTTPTSSLLQTLYKGSVLIIPTSVDLHLLLSFSSVSTSA